MCCVLAAPAGKAWRDGLALEPTLEAHLPGPAHGTVHVPCFSRYRSLRGAVSSQDGEGGQHRGSRGSSLNQGVPRATQQNHGSGGSPPSGGLEEFADLSGSKQKVRGGPWRPPQLAAASLASRLWRRAPWLRGPCLQGLLHLGANICRGANQKVPSSDNSRRFWKLQALGPSAHCAPCPFLLCHRCLGLGSDLQGQV